MNRLESWLKKYEQQPHNPNIALVIANEYAQIGDSVNNEADKKHCFNNAIKFYSLSIDLSQPPEPISLAKRATIYQKLNMPELALKDLLTLGIVEGDSKIETVVLYSCIKNLIMNLKQFVVSGEISSELVQFYLTSKEIEYCFPNKPNQIDKSVHLLQMSKERVSWDIVRMSQCFKLAQRSTCWKKKTAACITKNNRIISEGYNGTPSGQPHCEDVGPRDSVEHRHWSAAHETHGEINAILHALSYGNVLKNCTMYTVLSPCVNCAEAIVKVGINRIVYAIKGRQEGLDYLAKYKIKVVECPIEIENSSLN